MSPRWAALAWESFTAGSRRYTPVVREGARGGGIEMNHTRGERGRGWVKPRKRSEHANCRHSEAHQRAKQEGTIALAKQRVRQRAWLRLEDKINPLFQVQNNRATSQLRGL